MTDERVVVIPYDPDWPRRFEAERVLLTRVLVPWLEGDIYHVGSTAVPGLAAKPIIDMMAGVRDLAAARAAFGPLAAHGYVHAPHRPSIAHHFAKPSTQVSEVRYGLHLTSQAATSGANGWRSATPCAATPRSQPSTPR